MQRAKNALACSSNVACGSIAAAQAVRRTHRIAQVLTIVTRGERARRVDERRRAMTIVAKLIVARAARRKYDRVARLRSSPAPLKRLGEHSAEVAVEWAPQQPGCD